MKIAHIGLASYFTEGMTYQDNMLSEQNVRDGHEVLYVSNAAKYENGRIVETGYEDKIISTGVRLVRMPYERFINRLGTEKLRRVKGLYKLLCDFEPDVILCHALCYWSVLDVVRYRKEHDNVKLYADTHTDYINSGTNRLSMNVLHRGLYRYLIQKALPYIEKFFYVTYSCKQFITENYGVPEELTEFYPLGGTIIEEKEYQRLRNDARNELGTEKDELLFLHTGKLDAPKRTEELLRAFAAVPELKAKLAIIGSIPDNMKEKLLPLIENDSRTVFLGWKNAQELTKYLCGGDIYLQPGTASATMQNAVCLKCPVMLYPYEIYLNGYDFGNIIWIKTEEDMAEMFRGIAEGKMRLEEMSERSVQCAEELLDYRKLAARLYK